MKKAGESCIGSGAFADEGVRDFKLEKTISEDSPISPDIRVCEV